MIRAGTVSWVRIFSNVICFYSSKGVVTDHDLKDNIYDLNRSIFLGARQGIRAIGWF